MTQNSFQPKTDKWNTSPKFNSSPLKHDGWKTIRLPIFVPTQNFRGELLNFRGFSTHGQILWSQIYANDKHPQWSAWIHCFLLLACLPATCPDRTTQSWQPFVVPSCRPGRVLNGPGGWGTSSPRDKRKSNEDIRRKTPRGLRRQLQTFGHLKFLGHQKSSKLRFVNLESTKSPKSAVYGATFDEPTS